MQIIVTRLLGKKYKWITKLTDRVELDDVKDMIEDIHSLANERELLNAESVFDLMTRLNRNKDWMKEVNGMGAFRDLFKEDFEQRDRKIAELSEQLQSKDEQLQSKDEQLQSKDEQLQSKDEQLQSKDEQLKNEKEKNTRLQQEIEQLKSQMKEQMNKIAML